MQTERKKYVESCIGRCHYIWEWRASASSASVPCDGEVPVGIFS